MTLNKPLPQWVEEIDCPIIKKKVKKNWDHGYCSNDLFGAFKMDWYHSPEGYDYWQRIFLRSRVAKNCYHKDFARLDESGEPVTIYGNDDESWSHTIGAQILEFERVDDSASFDREKCHTDEYIPKSSLTTRKEARKWFILLSFIMYVLTFLLDGDFDTWANACLGIYIAFHFFSENFPK